jgi:hypothetical protein
MVDLPQEIKKSVVIVNADSPAENRRWLDNKLSTRQGKEPRGDAASKEMPAAKRSAQVFSLTSGRSPISFASKSSAMLGKVQLDSELRKADRAGGSTPSSRSLQVYSDEKMEWMRAYTALGENRWSMTIFLLRNGRVDRLAREVDHYSASAAIRRMISSIESESRL